MSQNSDPAPKTSDPKTTTSSTFDIVLKYQSLLNSDPDLTPPIAAIESLISLLTSSPSVTTISETLSLISTASTTLRQRIPNWIALSAGTDLFQRYLTTTLQRPGSLGPGGDFGLLRSHLLSNSRLFVQRAKEAREKIASHGAPFVRDGCTILTNGSSRVVSALLRHAAQTDVRFNVVYVTSFPSGSTTSAGNRAISVLRSSRIPVAVIPDYAVAYSLGKCDMVIVGAEGVVENGGIISRMGTFQIGLLAKALGKPFYVAAESYKFVRTYPLSQYDLPIEQNILNFTSEEGLEAHDKEDYFGKEHDGSAGDDGKSAVPPYADPVDFTPPSLILILITENGVLTPSAVSEELIKLWF